MFSGFKPHIKGEKMKVDVEVTIIQKYYVEVDVSEYSDDSSVESQAEWLMGIKGNDEVLAELCRLNDTPSTEIRSSIKIVKGDK